MPPKKKPSAAPRQTKSVTLKPAAATKTAAAAKPAVPAKGSLMPVWVGAGAIITLLMLFRFGGELKLPEFRLTLPEVTLPEFPELPELPSVSHWFSQFEKVAEQEEYIEPEAVEAADIPAPAPVPDKNLELLRQQLEDATQRVKQLESVVAEKDKAIQYEMVLRGKSLLGQYARLIEHAIEKGQPFPWELEQLQRFSAGNSDGAETIARELVPYAEGVPSMEKLQQDFDVVALEVYQRWRREHIGSGIMAGFWKMLHQIISIRKVGMIDGDSPEAVIARAEYHLKKGDIAQTYEELSAFEGSYASIVKPWMEQAQLRLKALTFVSRLKEMAHQAVPLTQQAAPEDFKNDLAKPKARPTVTGN